MENLTTSHLACIFGASLKCFRYELAPKRPVSGAVLKDKLTNIASDLISKAYG